MASPILGSQGRGGGLATQHHPKRRALRSDSSHSTTLFRSIPMGQYLRIRRNYSSDEDFRDQADVLRSRLLAQEYSKSCLKKAYHRAINSDRKQLIYKKKQEKPLRRNVLSLSIVDNTVLCNLYCRNIGVYLHWTLRFLNM